MSDNPDYCGPEGNRLRLKAQQYAEERNNYLSESKKSYENGDKAKAKELSDKGKEAGIKMEETNKEAAKVILNYRNNGHNENYLDLHGLYLEEALNAFKERLNQLIENNKNNEIIFEVIPGAGNHSKNKAVIKPKVIEEIQLRKLRYEEKNAGTLLVYIPSNSSTGSKTSATPAPTSSSKSKSTTSKSEESKVAETVPPSERPTETVPESGKFGCCIIM
mmetsp:Transcript_16011/g.16748  ORF Transcript_16011/g.16748 Transcript_16011/m.16748 type:complete len:219 (+) Transcript_16011:31-687(+)